jgi:hypothetical protein
VSNPPLNDNALVENQEGAGELLSFLGIEPGELEAKSYEDLQLEFKFEQANVKRASIVQAIGGMLYDARDCGRLLIEAKQLVGHGNFAAYLKQHFTGSDREARRYMQIAREWPAIEAHIKSDTVADLSIRGALSLLAEPDAAPQLPPAQDIEVIEAELVDDEESPSPPTPRPLGEGGGKQLSNPKAHNEHYTPDRILEMVYRCFGGYPDLDPCSNEEGEPNVKATVHYGPSRNGLLQPWMGRVFVNPPYNPSGTLADWTAKLLEQYRLGNVSQAIYLVPAYTDTAWWRQLNEFPVCLVKGRLVFKGNTEAARFPSAVFYLGHDASAFGAAFAELGDFWMQTLLED